MPPGKKLINDGMFKLTRNPNYLGEIMLYLSFAIVTEQLISYVICGTIWSTLFFVNIRCKEISLARKPGWEQYKKTSGMLLPKLW
jgi:protein-S-isoprenylcysteine O-methyltransferase Ste14